jgi:hypothetical protein
MSKDYSIYAAKAISPTMEAFAEWLRAETGVEVDLRSVALAGSLRGDFQQSESWKSDPRNPANQREANREARAAERIAKAQEAAKKAAERAAKLEADLKASLAKAQAKAKAAQAKVDGKAA